MIIIKNIEVKVIITTTSQYVCISNSPYSRNSLVGVVGGPVSA